MQRKTLSALMAAVVALATFALAAPRPANANFISHFIKDQQWTFGADYIHIEFTTDPYFNPLEYVTLTQNGQVIMQTTSNLHFEKECSQVECHWSYTSNFNGAAMFPDCTVISMEIFNGLDLNRAPAPAATTATLTYATSCVTIGSVRGMAFEDKNANGKWDAGEPSLGGMWYKVTGGGDWYVCGYVGDDNTYGVTVKPGVYYVIPVAPKGYRATTPNLMTEVKRGDDGIWVSLSNNIGFLKDDKAVGESCDQYHPAR